ncbi:MAG: molybdopterin-guanine dinucleotide biosynthesis protein B [Desulfurispora sp.]|uniref:molybdopterin-guanine dinucleotide biosynthesis protein B n=1 Tax=Desulfurispora sp. TaxID=3014275 RepID=UPI0040494211
MRSWLEERGGLPPFLCITAARSGTGKTTLLEQLINKFTARGYRLAVIKHHHGHLPPDQPGKDTWRYRQAGAAWSVLAAAGGLVWHYDSHREGAGPYPIDPVRLVAALAALDPGLELVLLEGYKRHAGLPGVEVMRPEITGTARPVTPAGRLLAVVADGLPAAAVPVFGWGRLDELVDYLVERLGLKGRNTGC